MYSYENKYSYRKNFEKNDQLKSKSIIFFNLKLAHKIFDSINFSLLSLICILFFLSLNSQKEWTNIYKDLAFTKASNNNLIDYISKTEEFYINKIESSNTLKKTTPKDLIYLVKEISKENKNFIHKKIEFITNGLKDSNYQTGY